MALNARQCKFVTEYLIDLNATKSAIRAGYSARTAEKIGQENLRKPEIAAAVREALDARERRTLITADRILRELGRIAFFDPRKVYDEDGNLIPVHRLSDDEAAVIAGIEVIETISDDGARVVSRTKKLRFWDKNSALEKAMRHLSLFNDKLDVTLRGSLADRLHKARTRSKQRGDERSDA
jgi:phage terminase small subunit